MEDKRNLGMRLGWVELYYLQGGLFCRDLEWALNKGNSIHDMFVGQKSSSVLILQPLLYTIFLLTS